MKISRNPHTGDVLKSKPPTESYLNNWEFIFKKDNSQLSAKCSWCGELQEYWKSCDYPACQNNSVSA